MTTLSTLLARAVVRTAEISDGISREALIRAAGLTKAIDGRHRLESSDFMRLHESVQQMTGNPALGLALGGLSNSFNALGPLVGHASSVREAIELSAHYGHAILDDYHLRLDVRSDTAAISFDFARISPGVDRMLADFVMSGMRRIVWACVGPRARMTRVLFEYEEPSDLTVYRQVFGCPLLFSRARTALEFPSKYLDVVSPGHDPALVSVLRQHVDNELLRRLSGHTAAAVRRYLHACAAHRVPAMSETARELRMSTRSLRRRLAEEGVSYRDLARSAMEASAIQMLTQARLPVEEVATRLGFGDVTSFQRAFKRWTGLTPRQFVLRDAGVASGAPT